MTLDRGKGMHLGFAPMKTPPTNHSAEVIAFLNANFPQSLGTRAPKSVRAIAPVWKPISREQTGEGEASCTYQLANRASFFYKAKFDESDAELTTFEPVNWVTVGRCADGSLQVWAN